MNPRFYLVLALCFEACLFTFKMSEAAGRPGARPPAIVSTPAQSNPGGTIDTGSAKPYHMNNQVTTGGSLSSAPQTGPTVWGPKHNVQITSYTTPKHLIGDPPLPSSIEELQEWVAGNAKPGAGRHPGATPPVPPTTPSPPHHRIGDPPTYPDDLGTWLFDMNDLGDDRPLLSGEVNLYTGPLLIMNPTDPSPFSSQTVLNWNPTTGIARLIAWQSASHPPDPSYVSYYYYTPDPPPPVPAPVTTPAPTRTSDASVSVSPAAPQISLGTGPVIPPSSGTPTDGGITASPPSGGPSTYAQAPAVSSVYTSPPGSAPVTTLSSLAPEDFTDDGESGTDASPSAPVSMIPDISPVNGGMVAAASWHTGPRCLLFNGSRHSPDISTCTAPPNTRQFNYRLRGCVCGPNGSNRRQQQQRAGPRELSAERCDDVGATNSRNGGSNGTLLRKPKSARGSRT